MLGSSMIKIPSRFDYTSSAEFNQALGLALDDADTISLDCSNLDYIDSAGIGLLVLAQKKAQARQAKVVLNNLKPAIRELLELANLQKLIDIY